MLYAWKFATSDLRVTRGLSNSKVLRFHIKEDILKTKTAEAKFGAHRGEMSQKEQPGGEKTKLREITSDVKS